MNRGAAIVFVLVCALCYSAAAWAETVEITVMMGSPPANKSYILTEIIEKFEKAHPNVKVNYVAGADQKVLTAIASGLIPDVATINNNTAIQFFKSGGAVDLTPFIEKDNFDLSLIPPNVESLTYNGRWYGMPQAGGAFADRAVFYNRDQFQAVGLAEPSHTWTWEQFAQNVQKLTRDVQNDGVYDHVGFAFSNLEWPIFVWSGGGEIFSADRTEFLLNKEAAVNALDFWATMTSQGRALFPQTAAQFTSGKTAMRTGAYFEAGNVGNPGFDWSVVEFPRGPAGSINRRASHPWMIPVGSKHPEAAWEWIKFWLSDEIQADLVLKYAWRPPQTATIARELARTKFDTPPYTYAPFMGINSTSKPLPIDVPEWDQINTIINQALQPVWQGQQSTLGAMNAIYDRVMSMVK